MPAPRNDEVHAFFLCQLSWSRVRIRQKSTVSRGEQTVRQSAPRAVKSHIACFAGELTAVWVPAGPKRARQYAEQRYGTFADQA